MQITTATTPGKPKIQEVPNVYGVIITENPVISDVKYKMNKVATPISAEVIRVLKNFLVLNAKNSTIKTPKEAQPIIM